jgi:hypothetical protein
MPTKTIVVLANSWKKGGRCLAGKEVTLASGKVQGFDGWVRPISSEHLERPGQSEGGQVTEFEMRRSLGRNELPGILEILEIAFTRSVSVADQPENWEVDASQPWRSLGHCPREYLPQMADTPADLWDTSGKGWSRVDESLPKEASFASLYFVAPRGMLMAEVGFRPIAPGATQQKLFKILYMPYGGKNHEFRISDPAFDTKFSRQFPAMGSAAEHFQMSRGTHVTVSLTPAYSPNGQSPRYHYKMAAAIIEPAT